MIYIYNDFGGTHTTALAAAYHLKKLDGSHEPTKNEILNTHNFNKLVYKTEGSYIFMVRMRTTIKYTQWVEGRNLKSSFLAFLTSLIC